MLLMCKELLKVGIADCSVESKLNNLYEQSYIQNFVKEPENEFEINIQLKNDVPIVYKPRRLSFYEKEKLQKIIDRLLKENVIRESQSNYCSPIVLVKKKDQSLRLCIDYRDLNKVTVKEHFPTPVIEDHLEMLNGMKVYSRLDLKDGFHHVKVAENSIKYTSFVTLFGQYEYVRMPFGLTNAPKIFQRFVAQKFSKLVKEGKILLYFDDILVFSETVEEHLMILEEIFMIAAKNGLVFRIDKCKFVCSKIEYLGYLICKKKISPNPKHLEAIKYYPPPRNKQEVQSFVGLANYFRKFVEKFSRHCII